MSTELVMPSNHLTFCCPLLLLYLIFSSIRVFSSDSALHIRWPKYWSFNFSINPSTEYSGLILKSLLQYPIFKASVLWRSAFLIVQISYLYMTSGKTITLTVWTFVGKVVSPLFHTLSRFVMAFLSRSKCL